LLRAEGHDDRVRFVVRDNGPGIAAEDLPLVFDRFYRGSGAAAHTAGSGLGLAIVKAVAERHGAEVSLLVPRSGLGLLVRVGFTAAEAVPAKTQFGTD
jgi:two-component system OmpR family sensor kinase